MEFWSNNTMRGILRLKKGEKKTVQASSSEEVLKYDEIFVDAVAVCVIHGNMEAKRVGVQAGGALKINGNAKIIHQTKIRGSLEVSRNLETVHDALAEDISCVYVGGDFEGVHDVKLLGETTVKGNFTATTSLVLKGRVQVGGNFEASHKPVLDGHIRIGGTFKSVHHPTLRGDIRIEGDFKAVHGPSIETKRFCVKGKQRISHPLRAEDDEY